MTQAFHQQEYVEILFYFVVLIVAAIPLGRLMSNALKGKVPRIFGFLKPLEKIALHSVGLGDNSTEMSWREYFWNLLIFNLVGFVVLFLILKFQNLLPLNPQGLSGLSLPLAFNTAVSFVTNTNWQAYSGEAALSYFSQAIGLGVQNFVSAATGIAVIAAIARAFNNRQLDRMGNFWADLVRSTVYVLLPLSMILAVVLLSQGVVQNLSHYLEATTLEGLKQVIPGGPAASQIAIKQIGTNGGGFFGVNSAHPFENPTPLSNFLQMISILLLPVACVFAFGDLAQKKSHARALLVTMFLLFIPVFAFALWSEIHVNPSLFHLPFFEGKETRIGIGSSILWGTATSAASNGSVNAMIDSFSPLAGLGALFNILLGEVVFGGVGSGLYGLLLFVVISVFLAGLMVGRSPEYFGKKIEKSEVILASVGILAPCFLVLFGTTIALLLPNALASRTNMGAHGLSEILYAFASAAGNNGSAFAGLAVDTPFYNFALATCMLLGRFIPIYVIIRLAGQLGLKKTTPESLGTFPTHGPSFVLLLAGVVVIVGALTFLPVLALGPFAEHFMMLKGLSF
ncbi:MAG: potassium-transporting ATPase subunit KdpA [Bdellovibrionota bacterium]